MPVSGSAWYYLCRPDFVFYQSKTAAGQTDDIGSKVSD